MVGQAPCKVVLMFSNYSILANYSWLLVEGHFLYTLVNRSFFSLKKHLAWYIVLSWGGKNCLHLVVSPLPKTQPQIYSHWFISSHRFATDCDHLLGVCKIFLWRWRVRSVSLSLAVMILSCHVLLFDNFFSFSFQRCWETRRHEWIWWILRVPVLLTISVKLWFSVVLTFHSYLKDYF